MRRTQSEGASIALRALLASGVVFAGLAAGQPHALALQGGEDPTLLPVLIDKRYGARNRHQLSPMFGTSMVTKNTQGMGFYLAYQYNFTDMLAIEVSGGYFATSETSIMGEIRLEPNNLSREPFLSDQYALEWAGMVNFVFVPVYGKISFMSEFDAAFDLFILVGAGAIGAVRGSSFDSQMNLTLDQTNGDPTTFDREITGAASVGGGVRFYLLEWLALRAEIRGFFYPELLDASLPRSSGSNQAGDEISGVTTAVKIQAGLQFSFGQ